ncbi:MULTISPECIES: fimbria/pilus periplasmic chaperone [Providencia]|uniref:Fimbria/pilus periplasmic chaperone n=1 Tax=Providencia huaxiensis TaxID=2027290 RepID=A0ABU2ISX8_9GAMM|nr:MULTISPECIES: fimbria/pilus periplasmic chaperone [Providencia]MBZ3683506.1 fimbria/pilus periplasmic chaperone [Providencia rettgeri]AXH63026.1 fimbria/pilus periplasmic chaperone [Providencia huaxiensis]MDT0132178.1 fimbria/pilus periplasmic chaperone [Providencia huaxiensis]MDT1978584.1 fimbria/pilus periplasmic chaperone [Providencia huaxiensis]QLR01710.1 fimbria/pilus periplasmic chaperone [Providencia rettgeri]
MKFINKVQIVTAISLSLLAQSAYSAIALDRTRIIYNEQDKTVGMGLTNEHLTSPYLAQAWIENDKDEKVNSPFIVTPPVHRIEANSKSQIKIQTIPAVAQLPKDRESVYYLNVREIPPRSEKVNVLQIALQTKIKLFYRPAAIVIKDRMEVIPQENDMKILKQGANYIVKNPSPYFLSITKLKKGNTEVQNFEPVMVAPFSEAGLGKVTGDLGSSPTLVYLNDFGGTMDLKFSCQSAECSVLPRK